MPETGLKEKENPIKKTYLDPGLLAEPWQHWEHLLPLVPGQKAREAIDPIAVMAVHPTFDASRRAAAERQLHRSRRNRKRAGQTVATN